MILDATEKEFIKAI